MSISGMEISEQKDDVGDTGAGDDITEHEVKDCSDMPEGEDDLGELHMVGKKFCGY